MRTVQGSSTTATTQNNSTHHPRHSEKDCPNRWWTGSSLREALPESVKKHGGRHQHKKKMWMIRGGGGLHQVGKVGLVGKCIGDWEGWVLIVRAEGSDGGPGDDEDGEVRVLKNMRV